MKRKALVALGVAGASSLLIANPALAEEAAAATDQSAVNSQVLDNIFIFISAVLVFLMQPGFALVEAGLTRAKNAANIMMKNLVDVSVGVLLFGFVGYSVAYPGADDDGNWTDKILDNWVGWAGIGVDGFWATAEEGLTKPVDFFFQAAFAATAATIVSGAVAGRTKFVGYLMYSVVLTGIIYPIVVSWQWGGGFLDDLGFVDFAGSGLVHMTGGFAALMGAIIIGPRIGKFSKDGRPQAMPGHSVPLAITGVFILFIGWFGFNPGSQLAADLAVPTLAVLTALAAASGAAMALATSWVTMGKPDVSMTGNGMLAGLVAICSGIGNLNVIGTLVTGAVAGIIVVVSVLLIERIGIDDPVGAFSVHGVCGAWGLIATGLLASATSTGGIAAIAEGEDPTEGLFYGGGGELLVDQLVGLVVIAAFVSVAAGSLFMALKVSGLLRVPAEEEMAGLDVSEHGTPGYGPDNMLVTNS